MPPPRTAAKKAAAAANAAIAEVKAEAALRLTLGARYDAQKLVRLKRLVACVAAERHPERVRRWSVCAGFY